MIDLSLINQFGNNWLFSELKSIHRESFVSGFLLKILYTEDTFNNSTAVGQNLTTLHEYLKILDFPYSFIEIYTNSPDIDAHLNKLKSIYAPYETSIKTTLISGQFNTKYNKKNSVCILPWIHVYVNQQGEIGPCCVFNENFPIGNIKNMTLQESINSDSMKSIRQQMLNGERPDSCSTCWKKEDNGIPSMRELSNFKYQSYLDLVNTTNPDGSLDNFKLVTADIRISNLCNLKCRMCDGKFSSRIAQDYARLFNNKLYIKSGFDSTQIKGLFDFITEHKDNLKSIYFAGGEPLLLESHYQMLALLIELGKTDLKLMYNTNLTELSFKNQHIKDFWSKFETVEVNASIDASGAPGEYARHGSVYNTIKKNYHEIKDVVDFNIFSVLSIHNLFNLADMQQDWISNEYLMPNKLEVSTLVAPAHLSIQILPLDFKFAAEKKINDHILWLKTLKKSEKLVSQWEDALNFMFNKDESFLLSEFFKITDFFDADRNESFEKTFPEYAGLRNYIQ